MLLCFLYRKRLDSKVPFFMHSLLSEVNAFKKGALLFKCLRYGNVKLTKITKNVSFI